jgi:hypothetical protein
MWKYKIGTVVRQKTPNENYIHRKKTRMMMFGHVIGFSQVEYDQYYETILVVKWEDGSEQRIHPNNVFTEEDTK